MVRLTCDAHGSQYRITAAYWARVASRKHFVQESTVIHASSVAGLQICLTERFNHTHLDHLLRVLWSVRSGVPHLVTTTHALFRFSFKVRDNVVLSDLQLRFLDTLQLRMSLLELPTYIARYSAFGSVLEEVVDAEELALILNCGGALKTAMDTAFERSVVDLTRSLLLVDCGWSGQILPHSLCLSYMFSSTVPLPIRR